MSIFRAICYSFLMIISIQQSVFAETMKNVCDGNAEYYENDQITSIIAMTGDSPGNPKRISIYTKKVGDKEIFASKNLKTADRADMLLSSTAQIAYLMGTTVDLCVTGGGQLYAIRLK